MSKENLNSPFKIIISNGITYREDDPKTPYSGAFNWTAVDGSAITSVYEDGFLVTQLITDNGLARSKTLFRKDRSQEITIYDDNGDIYIRNQIVDGKLDGMTEIYTDGVLLITTEFKKGRKNGECIVYHADGSINKREYYLNDVKQD
ncbi:MULTISPECIES: toxin-antitoxin system YwqK family antitoxin [Sphingobacterium]|jgi:antitoxin component YwqK of YwqJK toxin-antitoxin module|uniref:toxin-antitoxin system YwqK family antitoxin n=1 Tax=Sphingobacterium TaxID=28453 RepID=UPI00038A2C5B|nr:MULTISPECIES: hypothetical protein [Sphingobacterium]KKX46987.1 hypothetical protein L950_0228935 [Sphingobacterium sp. IITKGP-BTPF85]MCW2258697.1 antitoxin component YwqK of YwqJK toxin-antitoxin module [Sphingobacterium kitahiroshimense]TCR14847.1 hypothetical protein EDF67_101954 [Sphingobacterium sp. JUb78]